MKTIVGRQEWKPGFQGRDYSGRPGEGGHRVEAHSQGSGAALVLHPQYRSASLQETGAWFRSSVLLLVAVRPLASGLISLRLLSLLLDGDSSSLTGS